MRIVGNYQDDGYAHLEGLISGEVAQAFLQTLKEELNPTNVNFSFA